MIESAILVQRQRSLSIRVSDWIIILSILDSTMAAVGFNSEISGHMWTLPCENTEQSSYPIVPLIIAYS